MYIIFAGSTYYPQGGINDLKDGLGPFKTYDEALVAVANLDSIDWWQVVRIMDDSLATVATGIRK